MPVAVPELAQQLQAARLERAPITPLTDRVPDFDLPTAYAVQAAGLALRLDAGETLVGCAVWVDGRLHATAAGAAVLEHPAAAVAWMANHAPQRLRAGHLVLSGGLTAPVDLVPGTVVRTDVDRLGSVQLRAA